MQKFRTWFQKCGSSQPSSDFMPSETVCFPHFSLSLTFHVDIDVSSAFINTGMLEVGGASMTSECGSSSHVGKDPGSVLDMFCSVWLLSWILPPQQILGGR